MVPFDRSLVAVEGRAIHVMETGPEDGLPVLMLHGNPTWGFLYRRVAAALAGERLRLVMPDLVGCGLSDKPRGVAVHTLENHARWIGGLIDALGLERLVLVGQDWGGPIALLALAARPERLAGIVFANTGVAPPRADFRPTPFHRLSHLPGLSTLLFRGLGFPQNVLALVQGDRRSIRGEVARAYRWPLRGLANNAAALGLARMVPDSPQHPSVAGLRRCETFVRGFTGPCAIVWGDRDPILGRECARLEQVVPQAPVVHTEAGHFLQEEVPELIADAVRGVARATRADPRRSPHPAALDDPRGTVGDRPASTPGGPPWPPGMRRS